MSALTTVDLEKPFFGNAVNLVNAYVEAVTGIICVTKVPDPRPKRFIRTLRTGGFRRDSITDVARITFECWNTNSTNAERDTQVLRDLFSRSRGSYLTTASGARYKIHDVDEVAGPADDSDTTSGTARYTITLEIHLRGRFRKETP